MPADRRPRSAALTRAERQAIKDCLGVLARRPAPVWVELFVGPGYRAEVRYDRLDGYVFDTFDTGTSRHAEYRLPPFSMPAGG